MNGLNYLLQTNLYLLLFMGFYVLVLRNETFFRQNRFFLNTSIFLSFLIPFINSDWFRDLFITQKVREAAIIPSQMIYETVIVGINEEASSLTAADAIFWIYTAGAAILTVRFLIRLALLKSNLTAAKGTAFSFFKTLVVDKDMPKIDTIIDHENVHMRQWHSADIIFIELAAIVNWFNPVMYLYKKEIRHIHEFIADEEASGLMQSKSDYALLLFSNTLGVDPFHLSNNFFNKSLLKRRVLMLHRTKSRSTRLWKYGFSAPLFMLMLIVSAATVQSEVIIRPVAENLLSPLDTETSNKIMSALDLNKPAAEPAKESARSTTFSPGDDDEKGVSAPDYSVFKKHLTRNLKYPKSARDNNVTGIVVANFIVRNKKISGGQIEKSLHKDIDEEVIRALSLFTADVDAPDENYSIAINYNLMGNETQADYAPDASAKNFVGQVTVIAYKTSDTGPKAGMTVPVQIQDPELSIQDGLPQFPGGMKAWNDYLSKNLFYPAQARNNNIQGRVIASFVVDTDGTLEDIKVIRGIGGGADEEAVRMLKNSPKWIPGSKDGKPARVAHSLPIIFSLYPSAQAPYPSANQKTVLPAGVEKFSSVEVLPEFAGGMAGWGKYLTANLRYPAEAKSKKITGRVILSFIVEKDGGISDIKVLRGIGGGADEEAVRVLSTSPKWKPGIQNGRAVRVAYTMPIFFQLSQQTGTTTATVNPRESLPAGVNDFASVDILPDPPGGMPGWGKYLTANLKYPDEARRKNITGRVILAFIVEKDGSTSDIKVLRGIGGGADEEAVRVLKSSPKWKPGIDNGQPVRVAYTMPVFFQTSR